MTHLLWSSGAKPVAAVDIIDNESAVFPVKQIPSVIFDLTHDNEAINFDPLTTAVAIGMSVSPSASTRGYDDFLTFNPSVVTEYRKYPLSLDSPALQAVRKLINKLHVEMGMSGQEELMAHYHGNLIEVFRCDSKTGQGVWALVRVAGESTTDTVAIPSPIDSLAFEARMLSAERFGDVASEEIKPSKVRLELNTDMAKLKSVRLEDNVANLVDFPVGQVCIFKTTLPKALQSFLQTLEFEELTAEFKKRVSSLGLIDICTLLFRSDAEEKLTLGNGAYMFPNFGPPFYAGTQGLETAFTFAAKSEAGMGSPVFQNIRDGDWLSRSICGRLFQTPGLVPLESWVRHSITNLEKLPRFLIPKYLDRTIRALNSAVRERISDTSSAFVRDGDDFVHSLATTAISFFSPVKNAQLVHPSLTKNFLGLLQRTDCSTAAGFPHFSTGFMRSWGRDTFVALRGLYLVTGRLHDARDQLIAFAACLRHGLIPNLHDGGMNPRYNSRDAAWWFLQALQDYSFMSGTSETVFELQVPRLFPTDDQDEWRRVWEGKPRPMVKMGEIVFEIMNKHANGIHFMEWNAGKDLDQHMKTEGFTIDIVTDWTNGFIIGGNEHNCGTWMDKMGSSEKARNRGVPATSRDGAAVEIIGLLQSTLRWLHQCSEEGSFGYKGVTLSADGNKLVTWSEWSNLLCSNFESWFYIPVKKEHDLMFFIEEKHVNVRGVYKDTVGSTCEFADYQFRPNVAVAMTVAPELFDGVHAVRCLNQMEERLMGRIGMKTLDPSDFRYRPYYVNSDETEDFLTSCGFNYHNGPEWVWPVGYFFRASMRFRRGVTLGMRKMLANIKKEQMGSWANGLPELTQKDGGLCGDSCANQAWSVSAILDILYDYSLWEDTYVEEWMVDDEVDELPEEDVGE
jgi:glycogen debranching enzyme